ncbi:MAG: carbon storage regulator [Cyanobacteria bacterium P01_B01_bin.77]
MLILTRKTDETVILTHPNGDQIDVIETAVNGSSVSLGIDADKEVEIMREELLFEDSES